MEMCEERNAYLNRRMTPAETEAFEKHLSACPDCAQAVARWHRTRNDLANMVARQVPAIDEETAERLVRRATDEVSTRPVFTPFRVVLVGAAAVVAAVVALLLRPAAPPVVPDPEMALNRFNPMQVEIAYPESQRGPAETEILTPEDGKSLVAHAGPVHVGLDGKSRLRVIGTDTKEIRLKLEAGRVGVSYPPAKGRPRLTVSVNNLEVTVTGTVFLIERIQDGVSVSVQRGKVRVFHSRDKQWTVVAGRTILVDGEGNGELVEKDVLKSTVLSKLLNPSLDETHTSAPDTRRGAEKRPSRIVRKHAASSPGMAEIKQWVLNGEYKRAERALAQRLRGDSDDKAALGLLAVSQRKSGKTRRAVATLERLISLGTSSERNRARFRAGAMLQDRLGEHGRAAAMFEAYLRETGDRRANAAEARMRLATAYKKQGNAKRYRQMLRQVVTHHGGTEAAERAVKELNQLK